MTPENTSQQQAKAFGKVAVLMGGQSAEREISLQSGKAVFDALIRKGVDATAIDVDENILQRLIADKPDCVFNILHGRGGEDGRIQATLELLGIPYTGSGVLSSALSMHKYLTKQVWLGSGLSTPPCRLLQANSDFDAIATELGLPLIVKPVKEGSSIGMTKVEQAVQLPPAYKEAAKYDSEIIAEKWVQGSEYTVTILQGKALPVIRLETPNQFYDYDAKYIANTTGYHCPSGLVGEYEQALQELALDAFHCVGATGWGRVDVMIDEQGTAWLIEVNTVPGMTDHSLVPMAAKAAGIEFDELVWQILQTCEEKK